MLRPEMDAGVAALEAVTERVYRRMENLDDSDGYAGIYLATGTTLGRSPSSA